MVVDWTFRLGDIISFAGFAGGGLSVIFLMKSDIRAIALKLGFLEATVKRENENQNAKIDKQSEEIARFAQLLTLMGRYEERFLNLQQQMDDLKHGRGFIRETN